MTVLGVGNEKADDKEQLVGKEDVATIMPNRYRLVKLQRRRSVITLILSLGFLLILLGGIFLTVCYFKKIGPFRRHYMGKCPVGSPRFNGHTRVFESYEITDKYALIHVPSFNLKNGLFDSVRILHVFDKKLTVIQHDSRCFIKPMMKYQMLRSDWLEKLQMISRHHLRSPARFAYFNLQIVRPQLSSNYLRDEVHLMADAICNNRPVFRLEFQTPPHRRYPWMQRCYNKCNSTCPIAQQTFSWKMVGNRRCQVCQCKLSGAGGFINDQLHSSNRVDSACKNIRCENTCADKRRLGCVKCRCIDQENIFNENKKILPVKTDIRLDPLIVNDGAVPTVPANGVHGASENDVNIITETPVYFERRRFQPIFDYVKPLGLHRNKRSADKRQCKVVAQVYEGYTPLDYDRAVPLDFIYDC